MKFKQFCLAKLFLTTFYQVGTDSFFFGASIHIGAHFEILGKSFDGDKKKFVKKHQVIIDLVEDLNNLIRPVLFVQFLISSMLLCVIGFQIVMFQDVFQLFTHLNFGAAVMIQLFVYAYGGQIIMDKSLLVADELYDLDTDMVTIISRVQKASTIKYLFYIANLPTFSAILSSAASFITLLQSLLEK